MAADTPLPPTPLELMRDEAAVGAGPRALPPEEQEDLARRVQAFYKRFLPGKSGWDSCNATAHKYRGREGELFRVLYHKYEVSADEQTYHV